VQGNKITEINEWTWTSSNSSSFMVSVILFSYISFSSNQSDSQVTFFEFIKIELKQNNVK
jgi:hypothetical protein